VTVSSVPVTAPRCALVGCHKTNLFSPKSLIHQITDGSIGIFKIIVKCNYIPGHKILLSTAKQQKIIFRRECLAIPKGKTGVIQTPLV
jgi:hypothetical protein